MSISKHRVGAGALAGGLLALGSLAVSPVTAGPPPRPESLETINPNRVLDTRTGIGAAKRLLRPGDTPLHLDLKEVRWSGGNVVAFNLTATDATSEGWVRAWPCSEPQPTTSVINYVPAHPSANLVVLKLPADEICFASSTPVNLIADLSGWSDWANDLAGTSPYRLLDTRQSGNTRLAANAERRIKVAGLGGVPGNAGVAALNFTVVTPGEPGYVTAYECGQSPSGSTVNFGAGEVVANLTLAKLSGGDICFRSSVATDIIVDSYGWASGWDALRVQSPNRIVDTRQSWWPHGKAKTGSKITVPVAGRSNVPANAESALLNITVANAADAGYITVWPSCDDPAPNVSTVNTWPGNLRSNLVLVELKGGDGTVCVQYTGTGGKSVDIIVDAVGWNPWGPGRSNLPQGFPTPTGGSTGGGGGGGGGSTGGGTAGGTGDPNFPELAPGAALPSDAECAARVQPTAEVRASNDGPNHVAAPQSAWRGRVTGNFTGTTGEIIQWAACKWGIDVDMMRAMAYQESRWDQHAVSAMDIGYTQADCGAGQYLSGGRCSESVGITQVRSKYYGQYDYMSPWTSTAYNLDVAGSEMRSCFLGESNYLRNKYPSYGAGDMWGCFGRWFSGEWYNQNARDYIATLQGWEAQRAWERL